MLPRELKRMATNIFDHCLAEAGISSLVPIHFAARDMTMMYLFSMGIMSLMILVQDLCIPHQVMAQMTTIFGLKRYI